ncbi:MAG TPA: hypothetical protein VK700_12900 [Steroidobacteraceae bacterium]|jgi:hypothetical protein|nr:hypothetical protein [Steroidobacteraceae bacterium]
MPRRSADLEMYAVFDPRVGLVNDLRNGQWPVPTSMPRRHYKQEALRRGSQWGTWQMDRSWPERSVVRAIHGGLSDRERRRSSLPWTLVAAGFLAVGIVAAGLLAVGLERGLL